MIERGPEPKKLSPFTHGETKILDTSAIDRILAETQLQMLPGVSRFFLESNLNTILYFSIAGSLFATYDIKILRKLRKHFEEYERLSLQLQSSRYSPPLTPREWHRKAMTWFEDMETVRSRGGRPKDTRMRYFLPRALGLYFAVFGEGKRPTATAAKAYSPSDGPAARFVTSSIKEAARYIERIGLDGQYTPDQQAKIRWHPASGDALEAQIKMGLAIKTLDQQQGIERPAWQAHAEHFAGQIAKR